MRKGKAFSFLASLLASSLFLSGCASFSDLVPEEYGVWENYYIYRGNVRSKTTGDEAEKLVANVLQDGVNYEVTYCNDYIIRGDNIYMCLSLSNWRGEFTNGIVKYNVKNKTQENIFVDYAYMPIDDGNIVWEYEVNHIEQAFEDNMLAYGIRTETTTDEYGVQTIERRNLYFKIDYDGNLVEEESFYYLGYTRVSENYYTKTEYKDGKNSLYYVTWGMTEPTYICDLSGTPDVLEQPIFVEKNGAAGVLLQHYDLTETDDYYGNKLIKLEFINVKTDERKVLFEGNTFVKWLEIPENEYFLTFNLNEVTYKEREDFFKPSAEYTATLRQDCTLYKLDYANGSVSLRKEFVFERNKDFYDIIGVMGQTAYASSHWYETAVGCSLGGYQSALYKVDMDNKYKEYRGSQTEELKNSEDECFAYYALQNCPSFGNYAYYIQEKEYQTLSSKEYAYLLKRYDKTNQKTEVMQLWKSDGYDQEEKYCQEMWKSTGGDMYEYIIRDY